MERRSGFIFLFLLGVVFTGWFTSNVFGYTEKPEKFIIYQAHDISGPMGPLIAPSVPASHDFCGWYNKTKGGIRGVPVETEIRDHAGKIEAGISCYEDFRQRTPRPPIVMVTSSNVGEAIKQRVTNDKIVNFIESSGTSVIFPLGGYTVGTLPSYPGICAGTLSWAKSNWKGGKMKVGLLTWDNAFGRAIFDEELRKWFSKQDGMELVAEEVFQPTAVDVTTQVIRLKNKGVNWIYDNAISNGPVLINKALKNLGLLSQDINDTTASNIHRATGCWAMSDEVIRLGGGPGGLMEGLIGMLHIASFAEKENPGVQIVEKSMEEHHRDAKLRTIYYIGIWSKLYFTCEIIGRVVDKYGWKGVTGDNILREMVNTKDFDAIGIQDFTYSPDYPILGKSKVYMVKKGNLLPVSGYLAIPKFVPEIDKSK